jgi:lysozyme
MMCHDEAVLAFLTEVEGRRRFAYLDLGKTGVPTIGIGHCLTQSERRSGKVYIESHSVRYKYGLTSEQIKALFQQDMRPIALLIHSDNSTLSETQFTALASFCFNVGTTAYLNSTLRKKLLTDNYLAIPAQLRRWIYDNGKIIQGLVNRREREITLWESN